ncbi:hypothetical protein JOB18_029979 [Solea senegalensis]|uniref:Uncharacterized protein n=1 Tax=Solea senegalensis TaxID=28829 RepID=A0AAV6R615_SOLSE|nr:hypothetical protein JOB18_029979 [Solea senegalensis]
MDVEEKGPADRQPTVGSPLSRSSPSSALPHGLHAPVSSACLFAPGRRLFTDGWPGVVQFTEEEVNGLSAWTQYTTSEEEEEEAAATADDVQQMSSRSEV